jgi:hypothetical protein
MKKSKSHILLKSMQIKSLGKAKKLAYALDIIEIECGIHSVIIELDDTFVCPDIDISKLNETPMEKLLQKILMEWRYKNEL